MKTLFTAISFVFIFLPSSLWSQVYQPFPTGESSWQVARCFYFYPPGWYDDHLIKLTSEDTLINGHAYKKLFFTNHHAPGSDFDTIYPTVFLGGMREMDKKVYFVSEYLCLDTMERCVYDFNATQAGEILYTQFLSPGSSVNVPHVVTGIDSVLIGSVYHRVLKLTDETGYAYEEWIEGMGSSYGLIYATYWMVTDNSYDLICFTKNKVNEYLNPSPSFGYCTAPFPPVQCDSLTTGTPPDVHTWFSIYPNPASKELVITSMPRISFDHFELRDVTGRTVLSGQPKNGNTDQPVLSLSDVGGGIYLLTLYSKGFPLWSGTVIRRE